MSYYKQPWFPTFCGDPVLDDSATYDTMIRIAPPWSGISRAFKAMADMYGWTHIVLVSDDYSTKLDMCWYGAKPFDDIFGHDENYTFSWLRLPSEPTNEQLDDILQEIRSRTRGLCFISAYYTCLLYTSDAADE